MAEFETRTSVRAFLRALHLELTGDQKSGPFLWQNSCSVRNQSVFTFRRSYFLATVLLLLTEALIALHVHDRIIRPYFGDFLAVVLVYCLVRKFFAVPGAPGRAPGARRDLRIGTAAPGALPAAQGPAADAAGPGAARQFLFLAGHPVVHRGHGAVLWAERHRADFRRLQKPNSNGAATAAASEYPEMARPAVGPPVAKPGR